eukprot:gene23076-27924_t
MTDVIRVLKDVIFSTWSQELFLALILSVLFAVFVWILTKEARTRWALRHEHFQEMLTELVIDAGAYTIGWCLSSVLENFPTQSVQGSTYSIIAAYAALRARMEEWKNRGKLYTLSWLVGAEDLDRFYSMFMHIFDHAVGILVGFLVLRIAGLVSGQDMEAVPRGRRLGWPYAKDLEAVLGGDGWVDPARRTWRLFLGGDGWGDPARWTWRLFSGETAG